MKKLILLFVLSTTITHLSEACSCNGSPNFINVITNNNFSPELIVRGVKIADHYYGMKFRIQEVLKGQETRSDIIVWGDNGALCRVSTSGFAKGEELILALYPTDKMGNDIRAPEYPENLEKEGDYHLSICGVHYLALDNNRVRGQITESNTLMNYTDFKHLLGVKEAAPAEGEAFLVYPNPAPFGQFKISYHLPNTQALTISVYNVLGKEVKKYQVDLPAEKGTLEIDAKDVSDGVYFIEIAGKGLKKMERIIFL